MGESSKWESVFNGREWSMVESGRWREIYLSLHYTYFFIRARFIRAKMMSTENFGKNKGQSVLNFLDVRARQWRKK